LDEDFFLYYEDADLCRRARAAGWAVLHEPCLQVVHHRPLHRRKVSPHLRVLTRHALLTYAAKHWPSWQARFLSGIVALEAWGRRWHARSQARRGAAALFGELGRLALDMACGRAIQARRRLDRVVRREERRRAS
jgi:GT2 family glycosyltransferase